MLAGPSPCTFYYEAFDRVFFYQFSASKIKKCQSQFERASFHSFTEDSTLDVSRAQRDNNQPSMMDGWRPTRLNWMRTKVALQCAIAGSSNLHHSFALKAASLM